MSLPSPLMLFFAVLTSLLLIFQPICRFWTSPSVFPTSSSRITVFKLEELGQYQPCPCPFCRWRNRRESGFVRGHKAWSTTLVSWITVGIKRILAFRDHLRLAFDLTYKKLRLKKQQCDWSQVQRVRGRADVLMVMTSSTTADPFVSSLCHYSTHIFTSTNPYNYHRRHAFCRCNSAMSRIWTLVYGYKVYNPILTLEPTYSGTESSSIFMTLAALLILLIKFNKYFLTTYCTKHCAGYIACLWSASPK